MDYAIFAQLADSRTAAFLFTALQFVGLVIVGTIVLSLLAIWLIESLEGAARNVKAWLRRPKKLNGSLA